MSDHSAPLERPVWFASVWDELRRLGAMKPQLCRWSRGGGEATAIYECGCLMVWRDVADVPLPTPSHDGDELEFAELHLGELLREKGCFRHGNYREPVRSALPPNGYWTEGRCGRLGHVGSDRICSRCGAKRIPTKAEV